MRDRTELDRWECFAKFSFLRWGNRCCQNWRRLALIVERSSLPIAIFPGFYRKEALKHNLKPALGALVFIEWPEEDTTKNKSKNEHHLFPSVKKAIIMHLDSVLEFLECWTSLAIRDKWSPTVFAWKGVWGMGIQDTKWDTQKEKFWGEDVSNPLGSFELLRLIAQLKIVITSQWISHRTSSYFIHGVRQHCQISHFPLLPVRERFLIRFFQCFEFERTVDVMASHDFCQRSSWKITDGNVLGKFHIPTGCGRCINKGVQKIPA